MLPASVSSQWKSIIARRGKDKLVIMTAEQYRRLIRRSHAQPCDMFEAPEDIHQELMTGLGDIVGTAMLEPGADRTVILIVEPAGGGRRAGR